MTILTLQKISAAAAWPAAAAIETGLERWFQLIFVGLSSNGPASDRSRD
jgi:hypothetical protein